MPDRRRQGGDDVILTGKEGARKKTIIMPETQPRRLPESINEMKIRILSFLFYPAFLILIMMVLSLVAPFFLGLSFFNDAQAHVATTMPDTIQVGSMPLGIAYNPVNGTIYVANSESSTVSVINSSTNKVIETILVGRSPVWIEYDPHDKKIYVSNYGSDDVYVIDGYTNKVLGKISIKDSKPSGISYDSIRKSVYVAGQSQVEGSKNDVVHIIKDSSQESDSSIELSSIELLGESNSPSFSFVAKSIINDALYVSRSTHDVLSVINAVTNAHVYDITVRGSPAGIAYNPKNHFLYVGNFDSNELSVINPVNNNVVDSITVGSSPVNIVYDDNNSNMYASNFGSDTVSVINSTTNKVIGLPIHAGKNPFGITYYDFDPVGNPNHKHIYVTHPHSNTVTMIHSPEKNAVENIVSSNTTGMTSLIIVSIVSVVVLVIILFFLIRTGWARLIVRWFPWRLKNTNE